MPTTAAAGRPEFLSSASDQPNDAARLPVARGVQGLIIGGTTGEGHLMSWDEHIMLIAHTVNDFGRKLKVIGNTGSNSTSEALHATEQVRRGSLLIRARVAYIYLFVYVYLAVVPKEGRGGASREAAKWRDGPARLPDGRSGAEAGWEAARWLRTGGCWPCFLGTARGGQGHVVLGG